MSEANSGLRSILKVPFFYDTYQSLVGSHKMRKYITSRYMHFSENCKVLDIGCGTCELLDFFPNNIQYTGFDKNKECIESAKKRYGTRGNFICKDVNTIEELNLKENEYDLILLIGVLHHLNDSEVVETLSSAKKLLKQDGYVLSVDGVYLQQQSGITKYILSKDRGQHVRFDHEYKRLAESVFSKTEVFIEKKILRIPTDYIVMKMFK